MRVSSCALLAFAGTAAVNGVTSSPTASPGCSCPPHPDIAHVTLDAPSGTPVAPLYAASDPSTGEVIGAPWMWIPQDDVVLQSFPAELKTLRCGHYYGWQCRRVENGTKIKIDCKTDTCDVYVFLYHEPPRSSNTNGRLPQTLPPDWESGSCAPSFCIRTPAVPQPVPEGRKGKGLQVQPTASPTASPAAQPCCRMTAFRQQVDGPNSVNFTIDELFGTMDAYYLLIAVAPGERCSSNSRQASQEACEAEPDCANALCRWIDGAAEEAKEHPLVRAAKALINLPSASHTASPQSGRCVPNWCPRRPPGGQAPPVCDAPLTEPSCINSAAPTASPAVVPVDVGAVTAALMSMIGQPIPGLPADLILTDFSTPTQAGTGEVTFSITLTGSTSTLNAAEILALRQTLASLLGIGLWRIPEDQITIQPGSLVMWFYVANPTQPPSRTPPAVCRLGEAIESAVVEGCLPRYDFVSGCFRFASFAEAQRLCCIHPECNGVTQPWHVHDFYDRNGFYTLNTATSATKISVQGRAPRAWLKVHEPWPVCPSAKGTLANAVFSSGAHDSDHAASNCIDQHPNELAATFLPAKPCAARIDRDGWFRAEMTDIQGRPVCRVTVIPRQDYHNDPLGYHQIWVGNDPTSAVNNVLCSRYGDRLQAGSRDRAPRVHTINFLDCKGKYIFLYVPGAHRINFNEIQVSYSGEPKPPPVATSPPSPSTTAPTTGRWVTVSPTQACASGSCDAFARSVLIMNRGLAAGEDLGTCKSLCEAASGCVAINYFASSNWCQLLSSTCTLHADCATHLTPSYHELTAPTVASTPATGAPTVSPSPATAAPTVSPSPATAAPTVSPSPATATPTVSPSPATATPTVSPSPATAAPTGHWVLTNAERECQTNNCRTQRETMGLWVDRPGSPPLPGYAAGDVATCQDWCVQQAHLGCRTISWFPGDNTWCTLLKPGCVIDATCSAGQFWTLVSGTNSPTAAPSPATAAPTTAPSPATAAPSPATAAPTAAPSPATAAPTGATNAPTDENGRSRLPGGAACGSITDRAVCCTRLDGRAAWLDEKCVPALAGQNFGGVVCSVLPYVEADPGRLAKMGPCPDTATGAPTVSPSPATAAPTAATSAPSVAPTPATDAPGPVGIGCFADTHDRALPVQRSSGGNWGGISVAQCSDLCTGYNYFALQYTGECWCGDFYDKHGPATGCTCPANSVSMAWKNCVYDNRAPAGTCSVEGSLTNAAFSNNDWDSAHAASNCIDRSVDELKPSFQPAPPCASLPGTGVWLRMEMTEPGRTVCRVRITPRQDCCWTRMGYHEVWVGDNPTSAVYNHRCSGRQAPSQRDPFEHIISDPHCRGRYLFVYQPGPTINSFNFNEVGVHYDTAISNAGSCRVGDRVVGEEIAGCSLSCSAFPTLPEAQAACCIEPTCGGVTQLFSGPNSGMYELRAAAATTSSTDQPAPRSWLKTSDDWPACSAQGSLANAQFSNGHWDTNHAASFCIDQHAQELDLSFQPANPCASLGGTDVSFRAEMTDIQGRTVCRVRVTPRRDCCWARLGVHQIWVGDDPAGPGSPNNVMCSERDWTQYGAAGRDPFDHVIQNPACKGRYVWLFKPGPTDASLNFNELEVFFSGQPATFRQAGSTVCSGGTCDPYKSALWVNRPNGAPAIAGSLANCQAYCYQQYDAGCRYINYWSDTTWCQLLKAGCVIHGSCYSPAEYWTLEPAA